MFCKSCGEELLAEAVICPKCGSPTENFTKEKSSGEVSVTLIVFGYILAALMPLIGGIIGIYTMVKGKPGNGVGIMVVALIMFFFWAGFWGSM